MQLIRFAIFSLCFGSISCAFAHKIAPTLGVGGQPVLLLAGTPVLLTLAEPLDPKTLSEGQMLNMQVHTDVRYAGRVLVQAGSPAQGLLVSIEKEKGYFLVTIAARSATAVDGQTVHLFSQQEYKIPRNGGPTGAGQLLSGNVMDDILVKT